MNLEAWPGYPEYRHILVGGQGIIIEPPNTDEKWGLLCEGDIDEIFKYKSLNTKYFISFGIFYMILIVLSNMLNSIIPDYNLIWSIIEWIGLIFVTIILINKLSLNPLSKIITLLEEVAEDEDDLTKRVKTKKQDQIGEISRWFNKFVNNQMNIVFRIKKAALISEESVEQLNGLTMEVNKDTNNIYNSLNNMLNGIEVYINELNNMQHDFNKINQSIEAVNNTMTASTKEMIITNNNALNSKQVSMKTYQIMNEIVIDINEAINSMNQLKKYSQEINGIIDIISGISNQTKLLALNASIEAARAGEHGKGFAVVADEIGVLASLTIDATRKISEEIKNIQNEVNTNSSNILYIGDKIKEGSDSVNKTVDSFSEIQKDIDNITSSFDNVSTQMYNDTMLIKNISDSQNKVIANLQEESIKTKNDCKNKLDTLEINNLKMQQVKDTLEYTSANMFKIVNEFKIE